MEQKARQLFYGPSVNKCNAGNKLFYPAVILGNWKLSHPTTILRNRKAILIYENSK